MLERTEREVADESVAIEEMLRRAVQGTKRHAGNDDCGDERGEHPQALAGRGPEIVGAPAERFRRVAMEQEAREEPDGKDDP